MPILLILLVVGLLLYALASNGKVAEIGRLLFACALLVVCFELARGLGALAQLQRLGR